MIPHFDSPWLMITGGDVVLPGGSVLYAGTLLINQGHIQAVLVEPPAALLLEHADVSVVDATGHWVTPGLIDQHLHGAFGVDFNQSTLEDIHNLLAFIPQTGITSLMPTLMTAPKYDLLARLSVLEEVVHTLEPDEARILGFHLEGPFLSPLYRGAHPESDLLTPSLEHLEGLLSPHVKRLTLAPELDPEMTVIHSLVEQGYLCSIGHSGAEYAVSEKAIQAGACCATHLFNAMGRIDHRDPGIVLSSLLNDTLYAELIADGVHLAPQILELTLRSKPFDKIILVSDCNALTGLPVGSQMSFGKQTVTVSEHGPLNQDGKLAGSVKLLADCVRQVVEWGLLAFPQAVQLATTNPAKHLGEDTQVGVIQEQALADVLLWDKADLKIRQVYLGGEAVDLTEPMRLPHGVVAQAS